MTGRLAAAVDRLRAAGVPSPEVDAAELLAHVLGTTRAALAVAGPPTAEQRRRFDTLVARRVRREPLQHLTGTVAFRHVDLAVGPGVFVPRPETEMLAGWAVDRATAVRATGHRPVLVDLCTGSGAVALALVDEVPGAVVHAVELDPQAFGWAEQNLRGTGVDLRRGDMGAAFADLDGRVDVVVCNPPYIPVDAFETVAVEARDFDPPVALWAGEDGLDAVRVVEAVAARLLRTGGHAGVEHADLQGGAAQQVFARAGRWGQVRDNADLTNRPRFVTAVLAP